MRVFISRLLSIIVATLSPSLAHAATLEPHMPSSAEGAHAYRFKLRDPQSLTEPYRRKPYKILLRDGARTHDGSTLLRGLTDDAGRTAIVRTQQPLQDSQWQVSPVVGSGNNSQSFSFMSSNAGDGIPDMPYVIDVEGGELFCGYTDEQGATAEIASPVSRNVSAGPISGSFADCLRLAREVARVMKGRSVAATARGLEALAQRYEHLSDTYGSLLRSKAEGEVLRRGSAAQVRALLDRQLAEVTEGAAQERGSAYNHVGYGLVSQHPPRHVELAHEFLQQAAALYPGSPHVLDSLALAQHLLGRNEEALATIDASIAAFEQICDPDDLNNRQIAHGRRGSILWALRKRDEALEHWALAYAAGGDGSWAAGMDGELVNQHIGRRAEGREATDLCGARTGAAQ
nr:hypothetical protein [uncultured Caldimonas sp.]